MCVNGKYFTVSTYLPVYTAKHSLLSCHRKGREEHSRVCEKRSSGGRCPRCFAPSLQSHKLTAGKHDSSNEPALSHPAPRHGPRLTGARRPPGSTTHARGEERSREEPKPRPRPAPGVPADSTPRRPALRRDARSLPPAKRPRRVRRPRPAPSNCAPNQLAAGLGTTTAAARAGGASRAFFLRPSPRETTEPLEGQIPRLIIRDGWQKRYFVS